MRAGHVHSAEDWRLALEPVIARYRERGVELYFRADAAFAKPEIYELLGARRHPLVKFYNGRGTAEQHIKEGKNPIRWTRLSCHAFRHNAVQLQLHALAYNALTNFLRTLALPQEVEHWSLTTLREKLVKIGPGSSVRGATSSFSWPRSRSAGPCSPRSCAASTSSG